MKRFILTAGLGFALMSLASQAVQARIVAIDLDLPLDKIAEPAPGMTSHFKIGDHHHARVFYDTAKVDPKTHRVKPLHMQHFVFGLWIPQRLDPKEMPMDDAWLDVGKSPYTYHYHSATADGSVDFDENTRRMTILHNGVVQVSAPYILDPTPVKDPEVYTLTAAPPKYTGLDVQITMDKVGENGKIGDVDKVRIVYDASLVDPRTHHVRLVNFQHFIKGGYAPAHADPIFMPVSDAWIDLSRKPYAVHFHALVNHGALLVIVLDEKTHRFSLRSQSDPDKVVSAGPYIVDPTPHTGPEIDAAATSAPPSPPPPPPQAGGSTGPLSVDSLYGQLLDNPQSKAVLLKLIPEVVNNPQSQMGRGMPLRAIAQFESTLTPDKLAEINASLASLPK